MNIKFTFFSFIFIVCCLCPSLYAKPIRYKTFTSTQESDKYLNYHYSCACKAYNKKEWKTAASHFERIVYFFSETAIGATCYYYLGVCYFEMKEYDFASEEFTNYLQSSEHPDFFEETIYYKYCIAEYFREGKKTRLFKLRYCPKWSCAKEMALTVYDEIIMTVPNHELAALSLYAKGALLMTMKEYRDSIEAFQTLIRRFPKHELTPQAYLNIAQAYYELSHYEFQNPDLLALVELNVRKFREDFPREERVTMAESYIDKIKELYAKGLCDIGLFYERCKIPSAAAIYYESSIEEFPTTQVAEFCRTRLKCIGSDESTSDPQEIIKTETSASIATNQQPQDVDVQESEKQFPVPNPSFSTDKYTDDN